MSTPIKTYDCEGCHSFCYGGYHMEEVADGYGDWVRKEDHDAAMNIAHARIAELEAQIATVAPAVDAQPVANDVPRGNDALFAHVTDWMNTHRIPFEAQNELFRILAASPQSEGWRKDAIRRAALEEAIQIIETHRVPVGNSPAGEMAAGWTMDALHEIRDAIRALSQKESQ